MAALRECLQAERTLSARLRTEVEQLASELAAVRSSLAWNVVGQVRGIKDQFIAQPGSRVRLVYDHMLHRLKQRSGLQKVSRNSR